MIKGRDFIITSLQPWEITIGSNIKDMALEIAKNNRILFVNTPLDWITLYKKSTPEIRRRKQVIHKKTDTLRLIKPNLWVLDFPFPIYPVNSLPDGPLFNAINKINNKKICRFIKQVSQQLEFKNIIQLIDNDIYRSFYSKEFLNPSLSIYYRRDNLQSIPFWQKHATRLEPLIIKKSDLVLTNSEELAQYARNFNANSYDIGQGVDLSAYDLSNEFATPKDITLLPRPIIGYIGTIISSRLNANLIYDLAKSRPDCSFVLAGKEDDVFKKHSLHTLDNVRFLGNKAPEEVPNYIASFDVCLNPQLINDLTIGNYPRKIDEYLAFGKPVLATETTTMKLFEKQVYLCCTLEDYQQNLNPAIQENNPQLINQRITFAHTHCWENSISKLYERIVSID